MGFAACLFLLGAAGVAYVPILVFLSTNVMGHIDPQLYQAYTHNPGLWSGVYPLIHSALFFLLPSMLMGVGFPLALQAW